MRTSISKNDRRFWWAGLCFLILLGFIYIVALAAMLVGPKLPWTGFKEPDDIGAGRELLAEKFSGPRYFQYVETPDRLPAPYISTEEARRQVDVIAADRQIPDAENVGLGKLIESLAEPSNSRIAGASQVNVLRLNLALDEQK